MGIVLTEMELILEHTQQGISHEVSIILTKAGNPVKKILLKLNLSDHSDKVLKLKNFEKDESKSYQDNQSRKGCALLQKKFKEDLFTYCIKNGILQDSSEPFNDNTNVANALREPFVDNQDPEEQEANIDTQPFQYSVVPQPSQEEMSVEFLRERRNQMDSVKTFLRKFNRISFYEMPKVLSLEWETTLEIQLAIKDKHFQPEDILELFQRLQNDVQNIHKELGMYINTSNWDRLIICYDDDDDQDYAIAIIPSLSTKEPDNSLSMGDEHLDTISAIESDEFIKFSVENLIPIPSESEGIPENMCDVPFHDNSQPLNVSKDQFEDFSDSNDPFSSTDDDSFSIDNIEYVEALPPDSELGCALLQKKFKEDLFTYCIKNGILQDSSKPFNDNTNVANAL
nr:hypothetical protein [Tanacetum cinerariifolium]